MSRLCSSPLRLAFVLLLALQAALPYRLVLSPAVAQADNPATTSAMIEVQETAPAPARAPFGTASALPLHYPAPRWRGAPATTTAESAAATSARQPSSDAPTAPSAPPLRPFVSLRATAEPAAVAPGDRVLLLWRVENPDQQAVEGAVMEVLRTYAATTSGVYGGADFVYLGQEKQYIYDATAGNPQGWAAHYFYDLDHQDGAQCGDLTRRQDYASATAATPYRTVERWYYPKDDTTNGQYIVNRVAQEKLWQGEAATGACVGQSRYFYDNLTAPYSTPPTAGLLYKVRQMTSMCDDTGVAAGWVTTRYGYDSRGNRTQALAAGSVLTITTTYDSLYAAYPLTVTAQPAPSQGPVLTTTIKYYGVNGESGGGGLPGQVQVVYDANQAATRYSYDGFGRLTEVRRPGAGWSHAATAQYAYSDAPAPFTVRHSVKDDTLADSIPPGSATYLEDWAFYDGLGQVVQTQGEAGQSNNAIVVHQRYNALGLLTGQTLPYLVTVAPGAYRTPDWSQPQTQTGYDALGRTTVITNAAGAAVNTFYNGRQTATLDELRHQTIATVDAFGWLISSQQFSGTFASPNWGAAAYATALYTYTVRDQLSSVSGPAGATTTITYDLAGRKTAMSDPDMGPWYYGYDDLGHLKHQIDAVKPNNLWRAVCFYYDGHSRLKDKTYPTGIASPTSYSCPADPGVYPIRYSYDAYNGSTQFGLGRRTAMSDTAGSAAGVRQNYNYSQAYNFRLTTLKSGAGPGYDTQQNLSYAYDAAGNVRAITDTATLWGGQQVQSFSYYNNALNQVWTAQATGGAGSYPLKVYEYNPAGNLTQFEGTLVAYNDAAHRHAATHVGGAQRYWYDANGDVITRTVSGVTLTLAYDAENRLISVGGTVTEAHTYDGDGVRVKAVVSGTTSVFVGAYYEVQGSITKTYYYAGAVRVAERNGGVLHWLLSDHLGSTNVTLRADGTFSTTLRYMPFGYTRYNPGSQITTYRFTGQRWDSGTGLYFYNARWYDPLIGRFIQADTIVPQPGNPQSLNRYAYVLNNPIKYRDPSGHWVESALDIAFIAYDIYDIKQHGLTWQSGLALVADVGGLLLPVATGGGLLVRAATHADDAARLARIAARVKRFAGASPEIMRGVQRLAKLVENANVPPQYRQGLAAQLRRAEEYYKAGQLKAVELVEGANRYDLVLDTGTVVEVKYWREGYARGHIEQIVSQLEPYQASNRQLKLEFVRTATDPITDEFLRILRQRLQDAGIDLSRLTIEVVD